MPLGIWPFNAKRATGNEQRRARRYAVNFPCDVMPAGQPGEITRSRTQNVSSSGLYLSVSGKWEVGTSVDLVVHFPLKATNGRPVVVRCRGVVARIQEEADRGFGIGATIEQFEFIHMDSTADRRPR